MNKNTNSRSDFRSALDRYFGGKFGLNLATVNDEIVVAALDRCERTGDVYEGIGVIARAIGC